MPQMIFGPDARQCLPAHTEALAAAFGRDCVRHSTHRRCNGSWRKPRSMRAVGCDGLYDTATVRMIALSDTVKREHVLLRS
jgi:hypothetical protein